MGDRAFYRIWLHGQFRLETNSQEIVTPRSSKMQAILAILAVSPNRERPRVWLQNRLWSDRGPGQSAASLRQDISEFRKGLGTFPPIIDSTRNLVRLVPNAIEIASKAKPEHGFLEGIRVRDPAFRTWLMSERDRQSPIGEPKPLENTLFQSSSPFVMVRPSTQSGMESFMATHVLDSVVHGLSELTSLKVGFGNKIDPSTFFSLSAEGFSFDGQGGIQMRLEDVRQNRSIWSRSGHIDPQRALKANSPLMTDVALGLLVNETSERLAHECLERWRRGTFALDATVACLVGIGKLFTFDMAEQDEADQLFELAFKSDPRGLYLAWRVMLRVIRVIEMHESDVQETLEEIDQFSSQALELEPGNSMVLSAAANAAMLVQEDMLAARELASRALKVNPTNPFAWDCNSIWHLLAHEFEKAHMMQLRARDIAADPRCKHWWDMGCALTATVTGRFDEAREFAESASALVPNFRPPLRYLTALYANEDRVSEAQVAADKLRLIEPDFTLDRMVSDPAYPAAALKRSSLANRALVQRLGWSN